MTRLLLLGLLAASATAAWPGTQKLRGMWVDAFHEGIKTPFQVQQLIERARRGGVNALFVQVRSRAQVYHTSAYEHRAPDTMPWFDGLEEVIRLAHQQEPPIQVHAWLNAHPLWSADNDPAWPDHIVFRHPEWLTRNVAGSVATPVGRALDFGHPEAADYLLRLYLEVIVKYRVDGIHLDFIRFTGSEWGYNELSLQRFFDSLSSKQRKRVLSRSASASVGDSANRSAQTDTSWFPGAASTETRPPRLPGLPLSEDPLFSDWRRAQVTAFVKRLAHHAKDIRPELIISAAVVPWGDAPADFKQSAAYRRCFQDWKSWAEKGLLDLVIPMLYFREQERGEWFRNWVRFCAGLDSKAPIAAGIGNWLNSHEDTLSQARIADGQLAGVCFFSYASTNPMPGQEAELFNERFYDRIAELSPKAPIGANGAGAFKSPITFGYLLDANLDPIGPDAGFYTASSRRKGALDAEASRRLGLLATQVNRVETGDPTQPVFRRLSSVLELKPGTEFVLLEQLVERRDGQELWLKDPLEHLKAVAIIGADCDIPFIKGDAVALKGTFDGSRIAASKCRWLGTSAHT